MSTAAGLTGSEALTAMRGPSVARAWKRAVRTVASACLLMLALSCHLRGLPAGLMNGNVTVTGVDAAGRRASWSPRPGRLSVLVVLRASDCAGCVAWFTDGVKRLLKSRQGDADTCFLFVGKGDGAYAPTPPELGVQRLFDRAGELRMDWDLPGLPYAFVWNRERRLALSEWVAPLGEDPAAVARRLERCFVLGGERARSN